MAEVYLTAGALAFASIGTTYAFIKGRRDAIKTLRNEVERIPTEKRLEFFQNEFRQMKNTGGDFFESTTKAINLMLFESANKNILRKVASEYLSEDEFLKFYKEIF